jgi:hypothetical protein
MIYGSDAPLIFPHSGRRRRPTACSEADLDRDGRGVSGRLRDRHVSIRRPARMRPYRSARARQATRAVRHRSRTRPAGGWSAGEGEPRRWGSSPVLVIRGRRHTFQLPPRLSSFRFQAPPLGRCRRSRWPARPRWLRSQLDELNQPFTRISTIALLGSVPIGDDDDNAVSSQPATGEKR